MDSVRNSYKQLRSRAHTTDTEEEEEEDHLDRMGHKEDAGGRGEVDINGATTLWRESSYEFWQNNDKGGGNGFDFQDPPSKLITQFLHKQKASGDFTLDMEGFDLDESGLKTISETPLIDQQGGDRGEVPRCSSSASIRRGSSFLRMKTMKSRLLDTPMQDEQDKIGTQTQLKTSTDDEAEEDPFAEEDLPEEFKKEKFNTWTVCQWVSLVLIIAGFVCSLSIPFVSRRKVWGLHLWNWMLLVLALICGRLVSGWGVRLVVFFIERNFLLRKRVLYFVYGVKNAVQNCLWLGLVLLAWHFILDDKVKMEINNRTLPYIITKILICMLVTTSLWLVKTLLIKVLASSFHVSAYFDRIQESLFIQYVIEKLSGPPLIEIHRRHKEECKARIAVSNLQNAGANMPANLNDTMMSGRVIGSGVSPSSPRFRKRYRSSGLMSKQLDEAITIEKLHKLNQKNVSAWKMKSLMNIVRRGFLSTLDEQIHDSPREEDTSVQIRNELEAKRAAKKIFHNVARPGAKYICMEDLMRFMHKDEASKSMSLFEGAMETNKVKKSALKNWVVSAFRERKALALTLNDTKTAVNQLHHMVNAIMGIIIVVLWLVIFGITTTQLLVVLSSQLLLVAFMFGNTCKTVFEAIIFLFVMHPYDVGDRCEIDGVQMIVEEMNILTTVFLRFDNQKVIVPNSILLTKPISNYYRSPDMGDSIDFCIHISTPAEKIALMKQKITEYIDNKTEHWQPAPIVVARDVEDMNKLKYSVWPTHKMNFQDMGERWVRRALLVEEMIKIFKELNIEYRMLPLDVNVPSMSSLTCNRVPSNWDTCTR